MLAQLGRAGESLVEYYSALDILTMAYRLRCDPVLSVKKSPDGKLRKVQKLMQVSIIGVVQCLYELGEVQKARSALELFGEMVELLENSESEMLNYFLEMKYFYMNRHNEALEMYEEESWLLCHLLEHPVLNSKFKGKFTRTFVSEEESKWDRDGSKGTSISGLVDKFRQKDEVIDSLICTLAKERQLASLVGSSGGAENGSKLKRRASINNKLEEIFSTAMGSTAGFSEVASKVAWAVRRKSTNINTDSNLQTASPIDDNQASRQHQDSLHKRASRRRMSKKVQTEVTVVFSAPKQPQPIRQVGKKAQDEIGSLLNPISKLLKRLSNTSVDQGERRGRRRKYDGHSLREVDVSLGDTPMSRSLNDIIREDLNVNSKSVKPQIEYSFNEEVEEVEDRASVREARQHCFSKKVEDKLVRMRRSMEGDPFKSKSTEVYGLDPLSTTIALNSHNISIMCAGQPDTSDSPSSHHQAHYHHLHRSMNSTTDPSLPSILLQHPDTFRMPRFKAYKDHLRTDREMKSYEGDKLKRLQERNRGRSTEEIKRVADWSILTTLQDLEQKINGKRKAHPRSLSRSGAIDTDLSDLCSSATSTGKNSNKPTKTNVWDRKGLLWRAGDLAKSVKVTTEKAIFQQKVSQLSKNMKSAAMARADNIDGLDGLLQAGSMAGIQELSFPSNTLSN
jgi:tetratricopeptide (TPR) repeat protein